MTSNKNENQSGRGKRGKTISNKSFSASTVALINAVMLAGAAHGQNTNPPGTSDTSTNAPSTKLPDVVVTGEQEAIYKPEELTSPKYTEPLLNIPQTVTVIPQALMEERNATSLRDVLRNVSGISIQAGEGGVPAGDNLSIRGFNARTDIFVDGVRDFGGYTRDPFNFEQVEVSKGPASSYAGRGSSGGSVNLASKTPRLDSFYGGSLGVGTDEYYRGTLDINQPIAGSPIEGTSFRLDGMYHNADVPGRDVVENERWGVAPSISLGLGTPTRMTFSYFYLGQDNLPDYGIPWVTTNNVSPALQNYIDEAPPVDFSNFYGLKKRDYEETRTDIGTVKIEHDFNESVTLRNLMRYGRTDRDSIITSPRFIDTDPAPGTQETTVIRRTDWKSRDQISEIFANQTDLNIRFDTGSIEHEVVTGVEYDYETDVNYTRVRTGSNSPNTDLFNPNPNDPYTENIRRNGARNEASSDSIALYAFDTIKFSDQWQLNGGVRWDHFDVRFRQIDSNGAMTNRLTSTDKEFTWRVGPVFKPAPNGSIYAAYGTSFNPSAEGLTLATNTALLDPEIGRSYEIGTKWELFDKQLFLGAAIFRTEKENVRTPGLPGDPPTVLDGEQRVDGFEFSVAGRITRDWDASINYAFLDSEIEKSNVPAEIGKEVSHTPRHTFTLWTTYQLPWDLEIGAGANFTDSRFANNTNTRKAPGYWTGEAMLAYHANKNFSLQLNVYNLTDEKYMDALSGGHFIPGTGRSATLTANFEF